MKKYLIITALVLGIVWDYLFWDKSPGISFPLFTIVCLAAGYVLLRREKQSPARAALALFVPILFFSIMTFIRRDPMTTFLNFAFTLLFVGILATTYLSGTWPSFGIFDYIVKAFQLLGGMIALPWKLLTESDDTENEESRKQRKQTVWQVVRGVALAIPVLLVFTALLSSADMVFEQRLQTLMASLKIDNLGEFITQAILVLLFAYAFIGLVRYAVVRSGSTKLVGVENPVVPPFLGLTESAIVLGSVVLLFASFVIVQFRYFFSGRLNIHIDGFTYAEYARRGFGELVAVAVFSLLLVQVLRAILKLKDNKPSRLFTGLVVALVALVLVILVSAFQRLSLYESAYGFSSLRTYSHVFIIWLGLLLIARVVIEVLGRQRAFINLALLAAVGFALTLNLLNVDGFIVQRNIQRAEQGEELDVSYLANLSTDAVPALVDEFTSGSHDVDVQEGIGAALVCQQYTLEDNSDRRGNWQSFHLSDWMAKRGIQTVQSQLEDYQVMEEDWSHEVITPDGTTYSCWNDTFMD